MPALCNVLDCRVRCIIRIGQSYAHNSSIVQHHNVSLFHLIRLYYLVLHPSTVLGHHLEDLLIGHEDISRQLNLLTLALLARLLDLNCLCLARLNLVAILLCLCTVIDLEGFNERSEWDGLRDN